MSRKRIYIAGPISKGDLVWNIQQADEAFVTIAQAGFAPFCPHWSAFAGSITWFGDLPLGKASSTSSLPLSHSDWLELDLAWVRVADAVLRLPGESTGADRETAEASLCGIPVFESLPELLEWAKDAEPPA